jgi:integrase
MADEEHEEEHFVVDGAVRIYRRNSSKFWQCYCALKGQRFRASTQQELLTDAKKFATKWYWNIYSQAEAGTLIRTSKEPTFNEAAAKFMREYEATAGADRSVRWVQGHAIRLRVHLLPFFGDMPVSEITAGVVQDYRVQRMTLREDKNPHAHDNRPHKAKIPARNTLHNEIVTLRLVLRAAERFGWIKFVPNLSPPYRKSSKVSHRAWFSPVEYKQLYTATREYAKAAPLRHRWEAEQLHDYVLFMANTGLRPDEANNLKHRDVEITVDEGTKDTILVIEVRGKRGFGYCKSTPGAVKPYQRLLKRPKPGKGDGARDAMKETPKGEIILPGPDDLVFPASHVKQFNALLARENLKRDRDDQSRTAYSLRHTYICLRLMEGADIYQISKNCRTSVEMIERFYAAHIKNTIDAGAINVRRPTSSSESISNYKSDFDEEEG